MGRLTAYASIVALSVIMISCPGTQKNIKDDIQVQDDSQNIVQPPAEREFNFKFTGYDINIDNPEKDRRSYYIIKIDKIDAGRTTIGLESQEKTFESNLTGTRHLLMVEKWALDGKKGKYVKLNNIDQPKPAFVYFTIPGEKAVTITLENDSVAGQAVYNVAVEE